MDRQTLAFYDRHAADIAGQYRPLAGSVDRYFTEAFPSTGSRILDAGSGSGRDVAALLEQGYDAHGFEPSEGLRTEAVMAYPNLKDRLSPHGIPLPEDADVGAPFDGILCSAVLMHIPESQLFDAAFSLKRLLKGNGRLLLSISDGRPDLDAEHRDEHGRLFTLLPANFLILLFERLGFVLLNRWQTADSRGRPDIQWTTLLFELRSARHARPLDRIETVLNRDRKTATYKLALFRALSEIGTKEYQHARWLSNSEVAIPIRLIAEKWFRYYWSIFDSDVFIPQNNGETPQSAKPIAFRELQTRIVVQYRNSGSLSQFIVDQSSDALPANLVRLYEEAIRCIASTIKEGPVRYASGEMFRYDGRTRSVIVTADAWREFCQLGHWIEPAVVLRWAEETERMAKQQVRASQVLDRLLVDPTEERSVGAARQVFAGMESKVCVWSDRALRGNFAVDHVIPFSLWHSNDLWNLLPCDSRINLSKSDALPERGLLIERKDRIISYWEALRRQWQGRFDHEVEVFTARRDLGDNWQNAAFGRLTEAIEVTAMQRGCERWRP